MTRELPYLLAPGGAGSDSFTAVIVGSIEIKSGIVARDEHEGGLRKIFNFGHTVGHAIEMLSGYSLAHGEAVAIGMTLESADCRARRNREVGTSEAIRGALAQRVCRCTRPEGISGDRILDVMRADKKARRGEVEYALPSAYRRDGWRGFWLGCVCS